MANTNPSISRNDIQSLITSINQLNNTLKGKPTTTGGTTTQTRRTTPPVTPVQPQTNKKIIDITKKFYGYFTKSLESTFTHTKEHVTRYFSRMIGIAQGLFDRVFGEIMHDIQPITEAFKATAHFLHSFILKPLGKATLSLVKSSFSMFGGLWSRANPLLKQGYKQIKLLTVIAKNTGGAFISNTIVPWYKKIFGFFNVKNKPSTPLSSQANQQPKGIFDYIGDLFKGGMGLFGGIGSIISMLGPVVGPLLLGGTLFGGWQLFKNFFPDQANWIDDNIGKPFMKFMSTTFLDSMKDIFGKVGNSLIDYMSGRKPEKEADESSKEIIRLNQEIIKASKSGDISKIPDLVKQRDIQQQKQFDAYMYQSQNSLLKMISIPGTKYTSADLHDWISKTHGNIENWVDTNNLSYLFKKDTLFTKQSSDDWDIGNIRNNKPIENESISDKVYRYAKKFGIKKPNMFAALIKTESGGNVNAKSPKGAIGLGQLMPKTAKRLGVNPYDVDENLKGSAQYYSNLLKMFDNNYVLATAAYNAGEGAVQKYGGVPPYKETIGHVSKVFKYAGESQDQLKQSLDYNTKATNDNTKSTDKKDEKKDTLFNLPFKLLKNVFDTFGDLENQNITPDELKSGDKIANLTKESVNTIERNLANQPNEENKITSNNDNSANNIPIINNINSNQSGGFGSFHSIGNTDDKLGFNNIGLILVG